VELHSGPPFPIHFKYSLMMNIVFITFMYGAGLPILFLVATVSFAVFYVLERLLIAYSFKQPPAIDHKSNENTCDFMMYAPLLFMGNGFWMYSN
jgi:hypothetical protein